MILDMRTIIFSYMITDIVCVVVIVLLWQQNRKRFAGTGFFVFNFVLQTTALFLIVLRGQIPDWISVVLANALAMTGALLGYMGLLRFIGKKSLQIHNYILLAVFVLVHAYFALVQPVLAARYLNSSVVLLIFCFQCAWLLLYRVEPGMRQMTRVVGIVFAGYCVISVVRIVEFFAVAHSTGDYLQSGIFEQFVLISHQMLFILLTYGLALMFNKRLLLEITTEEEKFSKAFHSAPFAITITRLSDGQIIEVNKGFLNITGYQLADVKGNTTIGMHIWDRDEDRAAVVSELASKGKVYDREFQFRKKSGERITGLFSADIITVKNEICVLSSINDITGRKQAEEIVQRESSFITAVMDSMPGLFYILDENGKFLRWNALFEKKSGYSADEISGMSALDFFETPEKEIVAERIKESFTTGESSVEAAFISKDRIGTPHFFTGKLFTFEGKPCLIGIGIDVANRKHAEEALRESERQYRNLFENSMEGIFQTTPEGKLISANMALAKIFGYECPEEIIGAVDDIAGQLYANPSERKKAIKVLRESGYLKEFECQMRRKDGTTFWAVINARLTENQPGKNYFEGFIIDINDRKRGEEEIIGLNVELEKKVLSRTNDLRNSQLALLSIVEDLNASNKKVAFINQSLEATNKELESFSYSVSHDLRAPLRSIDGFSQALLEDYQKKFDDTGRNYLARIRAATQNMGMLIEDMLKLSRISRFELRRESVDLSKMFREIAKNSQMDDPARIIDVIIQEGVIIDGDSALMRIALTDLIDNAWKFTGKEARPKIEFGMTDLAGKKVVFIRDNGVGFDMAYVDKLFGTFQRLHTKNEFLGTGIGLATVKRIITRHGGEVWAEGEVGKGAVFYFTLP
ncbi:MAG: PAS domain S-box protein [Smithellaceae bacterium]|nr:PAS domain S-box protein [Smithellaceae bacterium]